VKAILVIKLMRNYYLSYEESEWGWKEKEKAEELFDEDASYLVAENDNGALIAFSHFRFDMDEGRPVLYWYVGKDKLPGYI
jgi:N-alpha-acetyltransferase 40